MSIWMFALNGDGLLKHAEKVAYEGWFIDRQETTQFAIKWKRTHLNIQSDFQNIQMMNWDHSKSEYPLLPRGNEIVWLDHTLLLLFPNNTCAIDLLRGWSATPPVNHSPVFSCSKSNQREEKVHHFCFTTRNLYCSFYAAMFYGVADELWFLLKKIAEVNITQQKQVNLYFVNMSYFLEKIGFKKKRWIDP